MSTSTSRALPPGPTASLSVPSSPHIQNPSQPTSKRSALIARGHAEPIRSVSAAQEAATHAWRSDLKSLLTRAEERFGDVSWTTALPEDDLEGDEASIPGIGTSAGRVWTGSSFDDRAKSNGQSKDHAVIWAHKAILYARAPNTFQARYLKLRSPAAQLGYNASSASLVSLPTLPGEASTPQQSRSVTPTSVKTASSLRVRNSVRGSKPPSSYSVKRSSIRRPFRSSRANESFGSSAFDDSVSITSGVMTSDSEPEGLTLIRTNSRSQPTPSEKAASGLVRMPSFSSDVETSSRAETASIVSEASTIRAPMSLHGVSQAFFEATLEYLYTGEETMVDAFEFLFEDRLATDAEKSPAEKQEKLRSDMTFMWRSKLFSDVKIMLDSGEEHERNGDRLATNRDIPNIPDANMSTLSLPQTIDTDRVDESDVEDDELTSFSSHRMILASRSPYFAALLLSPYSDSRSHVLRLSSPPFTPASLHFTLGFLYTGTLFFSNRTFDLTTAFQLWRAGAYLQVETLQHLVASMIAQDFCHNFSCSPPCRKCLKRIPRTLAFASSIDVSDADLAGQAMSVVTGPDFGLFWAKEVGSLDPGLRSDIVNLISERVESRPSRIISVLRQLSIVGRQIDTQRASKWVDALRAMSESIEARLLSVISTRFKDVVESQEWADLVNGVGQLGDILEKSLVMLVDSLTESRAAVVYQVLVGKVLLREEGFEVESSRQAIEDARGGILRYLKRRWINVRALAGFNGLEKWCLKELGDELGMSSDDLLLPKTRTAPELPKTRTGLRPSVGGKGLATSQSALPQRRSGSLPVASPAVGREFAPRRPAPTTSSRLRTSSTGSSGSTRPTSAAGPSNQLAAQAQPDAEREPGPIDLRAAVLNRNAARTSVANGHRSTLEASIASTATRSRANAEREVRSSTPGRETTTAGRATASASQRPSPVPSRTRNVQEGGQIGPQKGGVRSRLTSAASGSLTLHPQASSSSIKSNRSSSSSIRSAAVASGEHKGSAEGDSVLTPRPDATASTPDPLAPSPRSSASNASATLSNTQAAEPAIQSAPVEAGSSKSADHEEKQSDESRNADLSSSAATKSVRAIKSAASLRSGSNLAVPSSSVRPLGAKNSRPASSMDKTSVKEPASVAARKPSEAKGGPLGKAAAATKPASSTSPGKHSYLKATPRPGGVFSLSSTHSGSDLRKRTLSGGTGSSKSAAASTAKIASRQPQKAAATSSTGSPRATGQRSSSTASSAAGAGNTARTRSVTSLARATAASQAAVRRSPQVSTPAHDSAKSARTDEDDTDRHAAVVPDDASAMAEFEDASGGLSASETDHDSDAAETAHSGPPTDDESDDEIDPDQTITDLTHAGLIPVPHAHKLMETKPFADDAARTISQLGGTTLSFGIPCIVSPLHSKAPRKHTSRFHATVKYLGPVLGFSGPWVGIEVALPLPQSLLAVEHDEQAGAPHEASGISAGLSDDCPGGLHDGSLNGIRYFDLTLYWDAATTSSLQVTHQSMALPSPYSPSMGSEASDGYFHAVRKGTATPTLPVPSKRTRMRYPERPERRERRRKVLQLARRDGVASSSDDEVGGKSEAEARQKSRGLFIRPCDVLWVVSSD